MQINCPSCNAAIEQQRPPSRSDPGAGEAWICFKCPTTICICCYIQHMEKAHPEVYELKKRPTEGGKKNKKGKKR
jgi:hypothetical protein